ncbi:MAG: hypothetical protein K0S34_739 [Bacillales bacterium]|jgi:hypothetical protein|nr:hypothetical protein [Bacillales bacterium]
MHNNNEQYFINSDYRYVPQYGEDGRFIGFGLIPFLGGLAIGGLAFGGPKYGSYPVQYAPYPYPYPYPYPVPYYPTQYQNPYPVSYGTAPQETIINNYPSQPYQQQISPR